jgi:hypothetical protein
LIVAVATIMALIAGALLRLTYGGDIEFKYDEHWLYEHALLARGQPFPWLGMRSSLRFLNPGLSLWVFIALARITGATTPIELAHAVQSLNILALVLVALFAWTMVAPRERESWLWGLALGAVNPMAVVFARKIWQQSVLPIFTAATLVGWSNRGKRWGAFLWGLVGACMGQVHISGFFLAAGFALWALLFDRHGVRWGWWAAGCLLGLMPLVPWFVYLSGALEGRPEGSFGIGRVLLPVYWFYWLIEPLGVGLWYSLGAHYAEFLWSGPGHVVGILHILALLLGLVLFVVVATRWRREEWSRLLIGDDPTAFTTNAVFIGCGVLMTVSMLAVHRSYMNVTFPLEFVWLAWMVVGADVERKLKRAARLALAGLWVVELLVSVSFLQYIHVHGGAAGADYGIAYSVQPPGQTFPP